jgi:hypothetical protein
VHDRRVRRGIGLAIATVAVAAGCSGHASPASDVDGPALPTSSATSTPTPTATKPAATVWLCRPDRRPDPCASDLTATVVDTSGGRTTAPDPRTIRHPRRPPADCFYAYPTVSGESGRNADLRIQDAERQVARVQATRFSEVCDVWSPMYRQRTLSDLFNLTDAAPDSVANRTAYRSLRSGWRAFLAAHDPSRPIVLLGHSQGASMLVRLIRGEVDDDPALRRQIALAVLLGGNVTVRRGQSTGGNFRHVPLCTSPDRAGCVIAYSSFPDQPPSAAFFGRPGRGVSLLTGDTRRRDLQVACVNPVSPGSHAALGLHPYFPSALADSGAPTPWTAYPGRATAQCRSGDGATWLQVSPTTAGQAGATLLKERLGALWGFHDVDVNLALGDLVTDAGRSIALWHRQH